ncbi:MAG: hypothetical protein ACUVRY_10165 [Thermoanaerobaculaceae bacterium]
MNEENGVATTTVWVRCRHEASERHYVCEGSMMLSMVPLPGGGGNSPHLFAPERAFA